MVYTGPAKGCQRCRQRHVKCDLERPSCRRCIKHNVECPGYRHAVDIVLRNETDLVIGRYQQNKQLTANATPRSSRPDRRTQVLSKEVVPSLETHALGYLYNAIIMRPARDWRLSHGHFDHLFPFITSTRHDSALTSVTSWLAVVVFAVNFNHEPYADESVFLSRAIKQLSTAITDPTECLDDDTLYAVVLLQHGTNIRNQRYQHQLPGRVHLNGAEALIKKRGPLNFQGAVSKALFAAARNDAVNCALFTGEQGHNWDLWHRTDSLVGEHQPITYKPPLELDVYGVDLVNLKRRIDHESWIEDRPQTASIQLCLTNLLTALESWKEQLPRNWQPLKISRYRHQYTSTEAAYLLDQWFLLRLETQLCVIRLHRFPNNDTQPSPPQDFDVIFDIIDDIIASESSLLGSSTEHTSLTFADNSIIKSLPLTDFPHATTEQCFSSGLGSKFLTQILDRLHYILSNAFRLLDMPEVVVVKLHERRSWIERERQTIRRAYPLKNA